MVGNIIASPIIGIWYWCTDQYIKAVNPRCKNLTLHGAEPSGGLFKSLAGSLFYCLELLGGRYIKKEFFIFMKAQGTTAMDIDGDQVFATMVIQLACWVAWSGSRWLIGGLMSSLSFNPSSYCRYL